MSKNSLANQLELCVTTLEGLNSLGMSLQRAGEVYEELVENLDKAGYEEELHQDVLTLNAEFQDDLNALKKHIFYEDMSYLQEQINSLKNSAQKFG